MINNIGDVVNNKQVNFRKMVGEYKMNPKKIIKVTKSPLNFSFCKKNKEMELAPELNQDEDEILRFFNIN